MKKKWEKEEEREMFNSWVGCQQCFQHIVTFPRYL
jgi:hypothetical protein